MKIVKFEVLIIKEREFCWRARPCSATTFSMYKSSKFPKNSNCHINLFFNSRGLKLGLFVFLMLDLSISGIL